MPEIANTRILPYPAADIFALVMDVERYPEILRHVRAVHVMERASDHLLAEVAVAAGPLSFSYQCRIDFTEPTAIDIRSLTGPFKHMTAHWRFRPLGPESTEVEYALDAQFESAWMEAIGGRLFAQQLHQAMAAFEARLRHA